MKYPPLLLVTMIFSSGCSTIDRMNSLVNESTCAIHANREAVEYSTMVIHTNAGLIEQSTRAMKENQRLLESGSH